MKSHFARAVLSGGVALAAATAAVAQPAEPAAPTAAQTVAYTAREARPTLIDDKPGNAIFGVIGSLAAIERGKEIVTQSDIHSPAADVAKDIATAYASAHSYRLADAPIAVAADDKSAPADKAGGANYVVDVGPPGMTLIYFPADWTHYDLMYIQGVDILDASSKKVVTRQHCTLKPHKTADTPTHNELLADNAAKLKALIKAKSEECAAQLKTKLKLPAAPTETAAATQTEAAAAPAAPTAPTTSPPAS